MRRDLGRPSQPAPSHEELEAYMPIVRAVVTRCLRGLPPNVLRDDLEAAGALGLLDALRRDRDRGPAFPWFARVRVRGAVMDELRAQDWLPRGLRRRLGARAAGPEASAVVRIEDLAEAQAQALVHTTSVGPLEELEQRSDGAALRSAIGLLPTREASIVRRFYLEEGTLQDIAADLGISAARVSQVREQAVHRLRALMSTSVAAA